MSKHEQIAIHEAGHAAMAYRVRRKIHHVEANGVSGVVSRDILAGSRHVIRDEIRISLAGAAAEEISFRAGKLRATGTDMEKVQSWIAALRVSEPEDYLLVQEWRTKDLLREPRTWRAVKQIATRLLQVRSMDGAEVERICRALEVPRVGR